MKKNILAILAVLILATGIIGCENKPSENDNTPVETKPNIQEEEKPILNENYSVENVEEKIKEVMGEDAKVLTKEEIIDTYGLGSYKNLPMIAIKNESEDTFEEVLIIKHRDKEEILNIHGKLASRYAQLTEEYKDNEKIGEIFGTENSEKHVIIKTEENVTIMVIAKDIDPILAVYEAEIEK